MVPYIPQKEFLALLMTGDGMAIGCKHGMGFTGKWVWKMKDWIDVGFMKLFQPEYLFNDWEHKRYAEPVENNELFESEKAEERVITDKIRERVAKFSAREAAEWLSKPRECEEFLP